MYEDDLYSPVMANDYEVVAAKTKKAINEFKTKDPRFHSSERPFNNEWKGKYYETIKVTYYGSGSIGARIRDAVTGEYKNDFVGKLDENKYFKVSRSTGEHANGPVTLFYSSPEEYENHQFQVVDQHVKDRWYSNRN
jgi:hypothetical protein